MILKNADIFDSEFALRRADVRIEDGKIAEIGENLNGGDEHDLSGCVILPGFIDIHIHGCGGADFSDAQTDTLETMSRTLASFGVTSFCPASMTLPYERIERAVERAAEYIGKESGAYIHGINMEGPFLSYAKRGAQNPEYLHEPDIDELKKLDKICKIRLVSLAPELPGAIEFAHEASKICTVSAAHTAATFEQAELGYKNGITHTTHLLNGMDPIYNRKLRAENATAELISDGMHIHPAYLALLYKILGEDRSVAVSDSMCASGLGDGEYELGGTTVYVKDGKALLADGTIAASTTNIFAEFRNIISFGVPVRQRADFTVLSSDLKELECVYIKGKRI